MHPQLSRAALFAALLTTLALPAAAHHIWLEPDSNNASMLHFGEYHLNLREASPGLLDSFTATQATLHGAQGEKPLTLKTTASGLRINGKPQAGESLVAQDSNFPLHTWQQGGKETTGWFHFAARLIADEAAQTPALTFDLTPTGKQAGQYLLTFQGKPLAKTKVQALTPSGWRHEKNTDAAGMVQFDLPWRGPYVFSASHMLSTPGERDGKKYDLVGYVTTMTYVKPQGLATLDAAPPMPPGAEH